MPAIIAAVETYATRGEICDVFREVFGVYQHNNGHAIVWTSQAEIEGFPEVTANRPVHMGLARVGQRVTLTVRQPGGAERAWNFDGQSAAPVARLMFVTCYGSALWDNLVLTAAGAGPK